MGFRDPNDIAWEVEMWDDFLKEFGPGEYIQARYIDQCQEREEVEPTDEQRPV